MLCFKKNFLITLRLALEATRMAARYDEMLAEIEEAALDLEALQGKPVDPRDTLAVSSIV